jgi:hypothetical protein
MTLNQIISEIQTASESHKQVNKFIVGELDFTEENLKYYPLVWLVPNGFNFDTEGKKVVYNFMLMVLDRHFESQTNMIEVLSDTALIMQDIITLCKRNTYQDEVFFSVNGNAEAIMDNKADILAGYGVEINVEVPYSESYCDIPL